MPNYSLLVARTLQDAENSATIDWKWEYHDQLHFAFRRPDNGEIVRFVADRSGETLRGLRWNTKLYLGYQWQARRDANIIRDLLREGFFTEEDPQLARPRQRRKDRGEQLLGELRKFMGTEEQK